MAFGSLENVALLDFDPRQPTTFGAKFVELPSPNHIVIAQEPAWKVFVKALGEFLEWEK